MKFIETPPFKKNVKELTKRFRALPAAIEEWKVILAVAPTHYLAQAISGLGNEIPLPVYKMNVTCHNLIGKRLRLIYTYDAPNETITFIEVYFKGDKENEDQNLITQCFNPTDNNEE